MAKYDAVTLDRVVPLRNKDYYWYLLARVRQARRRIWASIFIVDVSRVGDPNRDVRKLLKEIAYARFRGLDVRILTGDSNTTVSIKQINMIARKFMWIRAVNARRYRPLEKSSTHDKFVIIDEDIVILGSHNWTDRAFNHNEEDSLGIRSANLARLMEPEFLPNWEWSGAPMHGPEGEEQ